MVRRALLHTAFFCVEAAAVASADAIFRLISPFGSKARTIVSVPEECITLFKIQSYFLVCTLLSLSFSYIKTDVLYDPHSMESFCIQKTTHGHSGHNARVHRFLEF